ncbi:MAG: hypothetical protein IKN67_04690 [Alphaproteobacteria bacterium]|nr:hypothetical protein [Alphaproteobacteria bacterium]
MEKSYCYHCQKDINPQRFLWWKICPHCHRKTAANDDGLYLVCDNCGANNPVDAHICLKCGNGLNGYRPDESVVPYFVTHSWLVPLINFAAVFIGLLLALGILYISFYLVFVLLAVGIIWYGINALLSSLRR